MGAGFSRNTKDALSRVPVKARGQRLAELHALIAGIGALLPDANGRLELLLQSENLPAVRRGDFLLSALAEGAHGCSAFRGESGNNPLYSLSLEDPRLLIPLLKELWLMSGKGALRELELAAPAGFLKNEASRRAFLRGAFLAGGYVSDPESAYHWEIICGSRARAEELTALLAQWRLSARIGSRKGGFRVYMKNSEDISMALSLMGAQASVLQWESVRAFRSLHGQVNRVVNCDMANSGKASRTGEEQVKAILSIRDKMGLDKLPDSLREMALLRLEHPDLALKDLGVLMDPPVGKSGVNHRLRKLMQMAEEL